MKSQSRHESRNHQELLFQESRNNLQGFSIKVSKDRFNEMDVMADYYRKGSHISVTYRVDSALLHSKVSKNV